MAPSSLALLLMRMFFGGHFGQPVPIAMHGPIGQVVPYQQMLGNWHGLAKNAAKTDSSWWGCYAMVRAVAACFVVVAWLSYNTQVVKYNAPTTPQPWETFPQFILMIKWYPVLGEHSGTISSLQRLFRRGEQLARDEDKVSILGGNIWGFGGASAHYSAR